MKDIMVSEAKASSSVLRFEVSANGRLEQPQPKLKHFEVDETKVVNGCNDACNKCI